MITKKIFTKRPLVLFSSFRLPIADLDRLRAAATKEEISQSEFVRRAVKERAGQVLSTAETEQRP